MRPRSRRAGPHEAAQAGRLVNNRRLPGIQGSLGNRPEEQEQLLTIHAIRAVPAYILIGPDGKLVHQGSEIEVAGEGLERLLK